MMQENLGSAEQSANQASLLKSLKTGTFFERRKAADDLASLTQSSEQVINALMQAAQTDHDPSVRKAAIKALEAPVNENFMRSRPYDWVNTLGEIKREHHRQELAASVEVERKNGLLAGLQLVTTILDLISLFVRK
jgi:hypothetical protein